jgi:hypothetical protein
MGYLLRQSRVWLSLGKGVSALASCKSGLGFKSLSTIQYTRRNSLIFNSNEEKLRGISLDSCPDKEKPHQESKKLNMNVCNGDYLMHFTYRC